jgi:cytidylate kinase
MIMDEKRKHRAIAIDGPAASGKSTLARSLAARLGLIMVNTGEMYRAITWELLRRGVDPGDRAAVVEALPGMDFGCGVRAGCSTVTVGGVDPGPGLRSDEVNARVSEVAATPEVRERLVDLQRDYLKLGDVVMEGRDIGTVVFPDTPFKIYIDASERVRSARREADGESDAVGRRDEADSKRATAPLRVAADAVLLDNSVLDAGETLDAALQLLAEKGWKSEESIEQ